MNFLHKCQIDRRRFLKISAAGAAAASTALRPETAHAKLSVPQPGPETSVHLAGVPKGAAEEALIKAVRTAAESATDFSWLSAGDTVFIKPALNSGNPYPATTHPAGIAAMVALLKEKGAGRVIVSDTAGIEHVRFYRDKITGSSRRLMQNSGIARAAESAGAELYFPEEEGWNAFFEDGPASKSHWKAGIMMPKVLKEVDHIILMPRCSRHPLAGSTLGLKAAVGYWRTDSRLEYHHDAATFQEKTAEANWVPSLREKQRLVLTTATRTQATYGPDKGYATDPDIGLIVASQCVVAHDMVSLAWLLENRKLAPESEKTGSSDPYTSQAIVGIANRVVVNWLGGIISALTAERLIRNDIDAIWDDRILNRAFHLLGGVPRVALLDPTETVPLETKQKLAQMVTFA
ncbi:MAG: DUF362 domain-containing protein [Candidatus Abyssobacteria bacterium SURF_5]|uniref:DUF362 domain-containing protein n=1 Tax=Abyssobacteria bacterium (strain SURF_5) TaxID=2093360 RepID=A0A3A4NJ68_ABYX5|nr:MAG: DUF362 domain-containing protein [Candidatus Abyssubacteria bacterium SURF_5]